MYLTLPLRGLEKRQSRDVRPAVRAEVRNLHNITLELESGRRSSVFTP